MDITRHTALGRVLQSGVRSVATTDLLAVALCRDAQDIDKAEAEATKLVRRMPGGRLLDLAPVDLRHAAGLEGHEALRVLAAMELGRRLAGAGRHLVDEILTPDAAYQVFAGLADEPREHFCMAVLNTKGKLVCTRTIHVGTLNMSIVGPREVFREAIRENAATVVLAHNHPSGDPEPSPEDLEITRKLVEVGRALDIVVADHIIVGHDHKYVSLCERGLM